MNHSSEIAQRYRRPASEQIHSFLGHKEIYMNMTSSLFLSFLLDAGCAYMGGTSGISSLTISSVSLILLQVVVSILCWIMCYPLWVLFSEMGMRHFLRWTGQYPEKSFESRIHKLKQGFKDIDDEMMQIAPDEWVTWTPPTDPWQELPVKLDAPKKKKDAHFSEMEARHEELAFWGSRWEMGTGNTSNTSPDRNHYNPSIGGLTILFPKFRDILLRQGYSERQLDILFSAMEIRYEFPSFASPYEYPTLDEFVSVMVYRFAELTNIIHSLILDQKRLDFSSFVKEIIKVTVSPRPYEGLSSAAKEYVVNLYGYYQDANATSWSGITHSLSSTTNFLKHQLIALKYLGYSESELYTLLTKDADSSAYLETKPGWHSQVDEAYKRRELDIPVWEKTETKVVNKNGVPFAFIDNEWRV